MKHSETQLLGDKVIARGFQDRPYIVRVCYVRRDTVYVTGEENYQNLRKGRSAVSPIGAKRDNVYQFDEAIFHQYKYAPLETNELWERLVLWKPAGERECLVVSGIQIDPRQIETMIQALHKASRLYEEAYRYGEHQVLSKTPLDIARDDCLLLLGEMLAAIPEARRELDFGGQEAIDLFVERRNTVNIAADASDPQAG